MQGMGYKKTLSTASLASFDGLPTRRAFLSWVLAACAGTALPGRSSAASAAAASSLPEQTVGTLLAIAQPASADGLVQFAANAFTELGSPEPAYIEFVVERYLATGLILQVQSGPPALFALTALGQASLRLEDRLLRDRARLFLLWGRARSRVGSSRGRDVRMAGVPPAAWLRTRIQDYTELPGPSGPGVLGLADSNRSGNRRRPREAFPSFLSFADLEQIGTALNREGSLPRLPYQGLVLCLGLSPQLMSWFVDHSDQSYREFTIPKRSGGVRRIESPRIFLKATQRILLDFFLEVARSTVLSSSGSRLIRMIWR